MFRHELETTIEIDAPTERVWSLLLDFASYPSWKPFVREISGAPDVGARLVVRLGHLLVPLLRRSLDTDFRGAFVAMNEALKARAETGPVAP